MQGPAVPAAGAEWGFSLFVCVWGGGGGGGGGGERERGVWSALFSIYLFIFCFSFSLFWGGGLLLD